MNGYYKHTFAQRQFRADDKSLTVKIHDTALIKDFYIGFANAALTQTETTKGHDKGVTIDGDPGVEH